MNSSWQGHHYSDDWHDYCSRWPVFSFLPAHRVEFRVPSWEAIEAEGELEAFDGLEHCASIALGLRRGPGPGTDLRLSSFQVILTDYRGRVRSEITDSGRLVVRVDPKDDNNLRLALVVRDAEKVQTRLTIAPALVELPLDLPIERVNMTLRWREETVCEAQWDRSQEEMMRALDGRTRRSPSAPVSVDREPTSPVAELVLGFMSNSKLAEFVARDLVELEAALRAGAHKAAVLLIGSIVEAALLDVLSRNEPEAARRLGRRWPDRVSLRELIEAAGRILVLSKDGATTTPLLPPLTGSKGAVVTDHRDLIHPRAEVRGAATVDENTVTTMRGVLGEIIRDLQQHHAAGVLDEYAAGRIA